MTFFDLLRSNSSLSVLPVVTHSSARPWAGDAIPKRHTVKKLVAASLMIIGTSAAAEPNPAVPDPRFAPEMMALFEAPAETLRAILPPQQPDDPDGTVRCFRYPAFTVQEVDHGEHGDQSIFVTSHDVGKPLPECGPVSGRLEKRLFDSEGSYFLGAKGVFGFVVSTSGQDGIPFTIHNLATNHALYADELATDTQPASLAVANDVLTFRYVRAAKGSCSIVSGGAACWKSFVAEANLPPEIANAGAPVDLCRKGYAEAPGASAKEGEPSLLTYTVTVELDAREEIDKIVRPGAVVSCGPQS